jgi:hypothetical protein
MYFYDDWKVMVNRLVVECYDDNDNLVSMRYYRYEILAAVLSLTY